MINQEELNCLYKAVVVENDDNPSSLVDKVYYYPNVTQEEYESIQSLDYSTLGLQRQMKLGQINYIQHLLMDKEYQKELRLAQFREFAHKDGLFRAIMIGISWKKK